MSTNKSILFIVLASLASFVLVLAFYSTPVPEDAAKTEVHAQDPFDLAALYRTEEPQVKEETALRPVTIEITPPSSIEKMIKPPAVLPDENEKKEKIISFDAEIQDQTGTASVRQSELAADLHLKISEKSRLGLGVSKLLYDQKDADAWRQDKDSRQQAMVKYQMAF